MDQNTVQRAAEAIPGAKELLNGVGPVTGVDSGLPDFHLTEKQASPTQDLTPANEDLKDKSPQQILRWAVDRFHPRLTMATAFGVEGCCLIHMLAEIEPGVRIFNLETGYQFPETLELRERIKERYGIAVEYIRPELTVAEYEAEHGGPLYEMRPDQCCHDRKILPLRQAVERIAPMAWISAIRKDQTADRAAADRVQWDPKFQLVKVNPLLNWTKK